MVPDDTREIQYIIINSQSLFKTQIIEKYFNFILVTNEFTVMTIFNNIIKLVGII